MEVTLLGTEATVSRASRGRSVAEAQDPCAFIAGVGKRVLRTAGKALVLCGGRNFIPIFLSHLFCVEHAASLST